MNKILLLLWKNLLIRRRHYIVTALDVMLPTLMALIIVVYNAFSMASTSYHHSQLASATIFPVIPEEVSLNQSALVLSGSTELQNSTNRSHAIVAFTPNTFGTNRIMNKAKGYMGQHAVFDLKGFGSEKEVEKYIVESRLNGGSVNDKANALIVFLSKWNNVSHPATTVEYKIRMVDLNGDNYVLTKTDSLFPMFQESAGPDRDILFSYYNSGFTGLQIAIDKALIWILTGKEATQKINTQGLPYPPYTRPTNLNTICPLLSSLMVLGFISIVPSIIKNVVSEKETGIKEFMKMMGLSNWMHWLGWMLTSLILLSITISIIILLLFVPLSAGAIIGYGSWTLWWVVFFLFGMATTAVCFLMSTFFQNPTVASTFGVVMFVVTYYGPVEPLEPKYDQLTLVQKLLPTIFPNVALHWAIKVMCGFEGKGVGAGWTNFFQGVSSVDTLCVGYICFMLIFDTVLFMMLTMYFENVIPSEYGLRRPWYYIFQISKFSRQHEQPDTPGSSSSPVGANGAFESEPTGLHAGIVIRDLKKKFGENKMAVDMTGTLKMYEGQITALLGQNGAGKTTTLSILTGLFAPTSGTATVNGFDIRENMDKVRRDLGLCPQHNMLFATLTVEEHLIFFGILKGLSCTAAMEESKFLLEKLHLMDKMKCLAERLSGGQKRKLCLGMALIGGTRVVILDEPTSGMDPETRRAVWDLLLGMRGERTIILTTHLMEEADVLGDRIVIMAEGKVKCCGTPNFLKQFYGVGYTLKITVANPAVVPNVLEVVQNTIPTASRKKTQSGNAAELDVTIPSEDNPNAKFPVLFSTLEGEAESLGIQTIGLSLATMDDIFIKVGEESGIEEVQVEDSGPAENGTAVDHVVELDKDERLVGCTLLLQQFSAIFRKHMTSTLRKWKLYLGQSLIPVALLILCLVLSNLIFTRERDESRPPPPLTMDLNMYKNPVTYFNASSQSMASAYTAVVGKSAVSVDNVTSALLEMGKRGIGAYRERAIVAGELNTVRPPESVTVTTPGNVTVTWPDNVTVIWPDNVTALYSSIPYHAAPLSVNLMSNAILRTMDQSKKYRIQLTTHPLRTEKEEFAADHPLFARVIPIMFGTLLPIGLALWAACFIVSPVEERLCKVKQIQLMTGVPPVVFWMATLLWDCCLMLVLVCVMLICFPIFQTYEVFTAYHGTGVICLILILYGVSAMAVSYLFSTFVATVPGGFSLVGIFHMLTGLMFSPIVLNVESFGFGDRVEALRIIGRFFPTFSLSMGIMHFVSTAIKNSRCKFLSVDTKKVICQPSVRAQPEQRQCCPNCRDFVNSFGPPCFEPQPYLRWYTENVGPFATHGNKVPGVGQDLLYLFLIGLFYITLLFIVEYGLVRWLTSRIFKSKSAPFANNSPTDADTLAEQQRVKDLVSTGRTDEDALVVDNLCKRFGYFIAVSELTFGVHRGECFGLLGVNGAGKTTTFRMLTGDESRSYGNAYSMGLTLQNDRSKFLRQIGYCPQFDGIIGVLTGKEMVELFARLRGVRPSRVSAETQQWLSRVGLQDGINVQCRKYSGGMKRRLCAAIALVGDSPIILLDEPTSGVDPMARRQFWKVIDSVRATGQAVILTSHSMEECEVLCSRLGIMVNGQFQCFGGVQHLKSKFGQGYRLVITLSYGFQYEQSEALCAQLVETFGQCSLRERHQRMLEFQVVEQGIGWGEMYRRMESVKEVSGTLIDDYSITETTLEEVFLAFARKQYPEREVKMSWYKKCMTCRC